MQIDLIPDPNALLRWGEILEDPELARWPGRIETDRYGRIVMSPPPALPHSFHQSRILQLLARLLPAGYALTECPLLTEIAEGESVLRVAPEICVEVLSPGNSDREMDEKRTLYFAAGAKEVWIVDLNGNISFFVPEPADHSILCPLA